MTFDIGARIIASDGTTVVREFHDHAAGIDLQRPITLPRFAGRRARTEWMHSEGDVAYGPITKGTGILVLNVLVTAATWAAAEATWDAIEADLWAEPDYFIEVEIEGVTRRYITDVPTFEASDVSSIELANKRMTYQLRFICQPGPVTTITI